MENSMKILTAEEIAERHKRQAQQYLDEHTPKDGSESSLEFWLINRGLRIIETMEAKYSDLLNKYEELCRPVEPVEAVEEPPRTRTRYQYFISYRYGTERAGISFGNAQVIRDSRISDYEDIESIQEQIRNMYKFSYVGLVCFIELDPIVEEIRGEDNEAG